MIRTLSGLQFSQSWLYIKTESCQKIQSNYRSETVLCFYVDSLSRNVLTDDRLLCPLGTKSTNVCVDALGVLDVPAQMFHATLQPCQPELESDTLIANKVV